MPLLRRPCDILIATSVIPAGLTGIFRQLCREAEEILLILFLCHYCTRDFLLLSASAARVLARDGAPSGVFLFGSFGHCGWNLDFENVLKISTTFCDIELLVQLFGSLSWHCWLVVFRDTSRQSSRSIYFVHNNILLTGGKVAFDCKSKK